MENIFNEVNIVSETDVQAAARILVPAIDDFGDREKQLLQDVPHGLCPSQSVLELITQFLSTPSTDLSLYDIGKNLLLSHCL